MISKRLLITFSSSKCFGMTVFFLCNILWLLCIRVVGELDEITDNFHLIDQTQTQTL